jgi:DNA-binding MarR family transcriptional regulator
MRQLRVLLILSFSDGMAGRELAGALGVGLAAVTGIANRLSARGLVRRAEDPVDRGVRRVYLTEAGE